MQKFDLIVIGAGSGLNAMSVAAATGLKVAIVEQGPMGGTCLNRGCIPSKILIHHADIAETIKSSAKFHIQSRLGKIDFTKIVRETSAIVDKEAREIEQGIKESENIALFKARGEFVAERTMQVGKKKIFGEKILIAAGTRPAIPPIEGIEKIPFLTSDNAMRLEKQPKSMIVVGGGYIATELVHFFGSLGTKITIIQRNIRLVPDEDEEIAETFTKEFSKKYKVLLGMAVLKAEKKGKQIIVTAQKKDGTGPKVKAKGEALLIATGRTPNTDILKVEKAGIKTEQGYIKTNNYLETTAKNVWALGDIVGKYLFKHSANLEARYAVHNILFPEKKKRVDYNAIPHAVFSSPQIAGVGATEQELEEKGTDYAVGKYFYKKTGMGKALKEETGYVKVLADRKTKKILGCHIIGPDASTIVHEAVVAMRNNLTTEAVTETVHIHPALSEVLERAFKAIKWEKGTARESK